MNLTIFANSTLYTPMQDGTIIDEKSQSCLTYLQNNYNVNGIWINGLTIFHILNMHSNFLVERFRRNVILLDIGVVEALTHPAANFLHWCCMYLQSQGMTAEFKTYVLPYMTWASAHLTNKDRINENYYPLLNTNDYGNLLSIFLKLVEGFSVIVLGMNKPNMSNELLCKEWYTQANIYNERIKTITMWNSNCVFIDRWNLLSEYVVDTTHLTPEGHIRLFDIINCELQTIKTKWE